MQRWEYKVVSFSGGYTASLNEHGRNGWELVDVVVEPAAPEPAGASRPRLPMPGAVGRLQEAASKIDQIGGGGEEQAPTATLLWVLRRPLDDA